MIKTNQKYYFIVNRTTLLLKNVKSVIKRYNTISSFLNYCGLNSNISKCKVSGVGALKRVPMTVCVLMSVDLTSDTLNIARVNFSYDKTFRMKTTSAK